MQTLETQRNGDWMLTVHGRKFWPTDPRPEDIFIDDIAHGLAHICRFGGHVKQFYSVAQHSVIVSQLLPPEKQFIGLMHDATEAYIGDMIRPLKYAGTEFRRCEDVLWKAIAQRFQMPESNPTDDPEMKRADNTVLMTERRDLMHPIDYPWSVKEQPLPDKIIPWSPERAKQIFLHEFKKLFTPKSEDPHAGGKMCGNQYCRCRD